MDAVIPILWFALLGAMFFVFIVRPQRRKLQAFHDMQGTVRVGDAIITTSGLHGTVVALDDDSFQLEIASGVVVRFARQAIGVILDPEDLGDDADVAGEADEGEDPGITGADGHSEVRGG